MIDGVFVYVQTWLLLFFAFCRVGKGMFRWVDEERVTAGFNLQGLALCLNIGGETLLERLLMILLLLAETHDFAVTQV